MESRQCNVSTASTVSSRVRRSSPTVMERGFLCFEMSGSDSESNVSRVVTAEVYDPPSQPFPSVPTITSIITRHNYVSRPSTSVTFSSHMSRLNPEMAVDLDAIEVVSSESQNSPSDYNSNSINALSNSNSNSINMLSDIYSNPIDMLKEEFHEHVEIECEEIMEKVRKRNAAYQMLDSKDCMLTDILFPQRDFADVVSPHVLDLTVTENEVLELPIVKFAMKEACYRVCSTNCYFCWEDMATYFWYRIEGESILYDEKRKGIHALVRPYVTPRKTIILSHETCIGEMSADTQDFIFRIYYKTPSFYEWYKNECGLTNILQILFITIAMYTTTFFFNLSCKLPKDIWMFLFFNLCFTTSFLFITLSFIRKTIKYYKKWIKNNTKLTLMIWKPSVKRRN